MKNIFSAFLIFALLFFATLPGNSIAAEAERRAVSDPVLLNLEGAKNPALVKVYSYKAGDKRFHHVLFKFADLLNRAIAHKDQFPADTVEINFALYKLSKSIYVGFNPLDEKTYGRVSGHDFGGENSEKLVESVRKAKARNVDVRFVFHNPDAEDAVPPSSEAPSNEDSEGIFDYLGGDKQTYARRVWWTSAGSQQMHNKFLTMRIVRKGVPISHAIYVATANGDAFTKDFSPEWDVAQTGVLVRSHAKLHEAYANYFQIIWDYANHPAGIGAFRSAVRKSHLAGRLNYEDEHFQAYFYPMPAAPPSTTAPNPEDDYAAAWVESFNPIAKLVKKLSQVKGPRHVKLSGYWCGARPSSSDPFTALLQSKLQSLHSGQGTQLLHIRSAFNNRTSGDDPLCPIGDFDGKKIGARTHEKNALFAFGGPQEFYSMTGSANYHRDEYRQKANNLLVIRETGARPIYDFFKGIFYSAYDE